MSRLGRGFPNNALLRQFPRPKPAPQFDSAGAGGTSSWTQTFASGDVALIWAVVESVSAVAYFGYPAAPALPSTSASIAGQAATSLGTWSIGTFNYLYGSNNYYTYSVGLTCLSLANPAVNSQTVTLGAAALAANSVAYQGVSSIGTPLTGFPSTGGAVSNSASNTCYVAAFGSWNSVSFTGFNQRQRYNIAQLLIGDAVGNGGSLTFSATPSTVQGGAVVIPLVGK